VSEGGEVNTPEVRSAERDPKWLVDPGALLRQTWALGRTAALEAALADPREHSASFLDWLGVRAFPGFDVDQYKRFSEHVTNDAEANKAAIKLLSPVRENILGADGRPTLFAREVYDLLNRGCRMTMHDRFIIPRTALRPRT